MNGIAVEFCGVCEPGQLWLPLSNVAAHPIVYVVPGAGLASGTVSVTMPTPAPESVCGV